MGDEMVTKCDGECNCPDCSVEHQAVEKPEACTCTLSAQATMLTDLMNLIMDLVKEYHEEGQQEKVDALEDLEDRVRARWEL